MLWVTGSICLALWLILYLLLHKTGMVHGLLLTAFSLYVVQYAQDRRARAHKASRISGADGRE